MELIKTGFEVLTERGYQPEIAYFEVCNELKLIMDLIHAGGLERMLKGVSDTAKYGGLAYGPKVIDDDAKRKMFAVLDNITAGLSQRSGCPTRRTA
jgi:ketol-acid reductoisomerase